MSFADELRKPINIKKEIPYRDTMEWAKEQLPKIIAAIKNECMKHRTKGNISGNLGDNAEYGEISYSVCHGYNISFTKEQAKYLRDELSVNLKNLGFRGHKVKLLSITDKEYFISPTRYNLYLKIKW